MNERMDQCPDEGALCAWMDGWMDGRAVTLPGDGWLDGKINE